LYDHFILAIVAPDDLCVSVELKFRKLVGVADIIIDTLEEGYFLNGRSSIRTPQGSTGSGRDISFMALDFVQLYLGWMKPF
jgi:hypothetical protein